MHLPSANLSTFNVQRSAFNVLSRRSLLQKGGLSLGSAALSSLLARDLTAAPSADITLPPHPPFAPNAKHVI